MNPKLKKALIFSGLALDVVVTVFLFVVSIIMLATMPDPLVVDIQENYKLHPGMITFFQANPSAYLLICVVPLALLLIGNIFLLVWYINKAGKQKAQLSDLSEDQKAALRAEILKDIDSKEEK